MSLFGASRVCSLFVRAPLFATPRPAALSTQWLSIRSTTAFLQASSFSSSSSSFSAAAASSSSLVNIRKHENSRMATILLNSPPVNALTKQTLDALASAIKECEQDDEIDGIVFRSCNPKLFTAGLDIASFYPYDVDKFRSYWSSVRHFWSTLLQTPLFTMAAIQGFCPGGGCALALATDYRLAVDQNTSIGLNESQIGLVIPKWFRTMLLDVVPKRDAELLCQLGTMVPSSEATQNYLDRVVPESELDQEIEASAAPFLAIPKHARVETKQLFRAETIADVLNDEEAEQLVGMIGRVQVQETLAIVVARLKKKK
mmetsp:Transcript_8611/g.26741  ORF Transcript_8611/g.26741 Transcript_8611/m.26741 type:complete len:315 (-) Transcript_8611:48-992(-)